MVVFLTPILLTLGIIILKESISFFKTRHRLQEIDKQEVFVMKTFQEIKQLGVEKMKNPSN